MFAIIETGGKQYRVSEGTLVDIELLEQEPASSVVFDKVLLVFDGKTTKIGAPFIEGATVNATILNHYKDDKVTAFKLKRKTGYKRTKGHRQHLTTIKVSSIKG